MASDATSSTPPAASAERIVSVPLAELRRRPDHRAECVTECPIGSRLIVLDERDEGRWIRVLCPDGYRAWIRSWATVPYRLAGEDPGAVVRVIAASVRARPDRASPLVCPVPMGGRLRTRPARGRWQAVVLPDGRAGWIEKVSIEADATAALGEFWGPCGRRGPRPKLTDFARLEMDRLLSRARELVGVPYRWGGATSWGIDCSGLTRLLLGLEGIPLPRDARDQLRALKGWIAPADPSELRAGDLVFFGEGMEAIGHVGLGIGRRPGRFVHASGCVRVSSLNEDDPLFDEALRSKVRAVVRPPY